MIKFAIWAGAVWLSLCACNHSNADAIPDDALAQRFRPYYKFTRENDMVAEKCRPCSWEWFVSNGRLEKSNKQVERPEILKQAPDQLLSFKDSDVRSAEQWTPFQLRIPPSAWEGQPWVDVVEDGAGLYAQVEHCEGYSIIIYWTLFAYNKTTVFGDHEGDITAVSVIYSESEDKIVGAFFGIHGSVLECFNLNDPISDAIVQLPGLAIDGGAISAQAKDCRIGDDHRYQDGPVGIYHSALPDVFLVKDQDTGRFEHVVIFIEWGSHEPWPNAEGSFIAAPDHNGSGMSFLPRRVRFLGSVEKPADPQVPLIMFNGVWGNDPKGIAFHRFCFYPKGRLHNDFKIPEAAFVDRDPYDLAILPVFR